jgi:hypothetical protein
MNLIHNFSTKQTYDVQNLLKTTFFRAQSQYPQEPPLSGKEISQNAIDLYDQRQEDARSSKLDA